MTFEYLAEKYHARNIAFTLGELRLSQAGPSIEKYLCVSSIVESSQ